MITKITGVVNRVLDDEVRLQVGAFEYQILVPEFIRRRLQNKTGDEITFHTSEFHEGNPMQGRVVPRLIGFSTEEELDFFELFCTVEKVGVRKAIKALGQPVQAVADAIQREDSKWLTTLPGIGAATAETIVTKLKRKVAKYALAAKPVDGKPGSVVDGEILEGVYQALLAVGHGPLDARILMDKVLATGKDFGSVEEMFAAVYQK